MRRAYVGVGLLGFVALAPFVLTMCTPRDDASTPPPSAPVIALSVGSVASTPPQAPLPEVDVSLPRAPESTAGILVVTMTIDGSITVNGENIPSDEALLARARAAHDATPDVRAVIRADSAVTHGRVIHVLDLLKQAQIVKIAFGVTPLAQVTPPPLPPPTGAPPHVGPLPGSCAELEAAINRTLNVRACGSDADCTTGARNCGCSVPMSRSAIPKLDALERSYSARACAQKGPPRPCASCPPPPPVGCTSGQCAVRP